MTILCFREDVYQGLFFFFFFLFKRIIYDSVSFSVSDSGSSQGLSQPSTQTTQYLRADTPNNAAPVTSKILPPLHHTLPTCESQDETSVQVS